MILDFDVRNVKCKIFLLSSLKSSAQIFDIIMKMKLLHNCQKDLDLPVT